MKANQRKTHPPTYAACITTCASMMNKMMELLRNGANPADVYSASAHTVWQQAKPRQYRELSCLFTALAVADAVAYLTIEHLSNEKTKKEEHAAGTDATALPE